MRLCIASLHPRALSGQIDSLVGLGRGMRQRGHSVELVAPFDTTHIFENPLTDLGSGPRRLSGAAGRMARTVPRIISAAREAELLHLALPTPAFGWLGDIIQAQLSVPVLVSYEGHLVAAREAWDWHNLRRGWKGWLTLWGINNGFFGRLSSRSCSGYVVSTDVQRQELLNLGLSDDRVTVIPNIVDSAKLKRWNPAQARRELGLECGTPTIGYIGHLNAVKGVDTLAEAFVRLAEDRTDVRLALAWSGQGDPRPVERILRPVEERVDWLGKVDVGAFLSAIDVLALPYRSTAGQGAIPSLVIEAMHMQRALVTSRLPLLEEVLSDERTALLSDVGRADQLACNLDLLLGDELLSQQMFEAQGIAGREFTIAALALRYEQVYESLVEQADEPAWAAAA